MGGALENGVEGDGKGEGKAKKLFSDDGARAQMPVAMGVAR